VGDTAAASLVRDRNFAWLWVGEALSDIGSQITSTAMPLLVLFLTGSAADAGLVGVAGTIAYPIAALPSGVLADRMDRRRLMMACALLRLGRSPAFRSRLRSGARRLGS
jgi:MFS family permease